MSLQIVISSNAAAILKQLSELPSRMSQAIAKAMDVQNNATIGYIDGNYLKGPRPEKLGVRTAALYRSIRASKSVVDGNSVESTIGTNLKYAGVHEYGFDGIVKVRGFTRANPRGNKTSEGAVVSLASGRIKKTKRVVSASGISVVKPFSRHMKMPARPYLEPGIADNMINYSTAISRAIESAWNEGAVTT